MVYYTSKIAFQRSPMTTTTTYASIQTSYINDNKINVGKINNIYTTTVLNNNNDYYAENNLFDNDSYSNYVDKAGGPEPETDEAVNNEIFDTAIDTTTDNQTDNQTQIIIIVLSIVILCIFSLTLVKLKNRTNDNNPIQERSVYDQNKPLPHISPSLLNKQNLSYQQMPSLQVQNSMIVNMDYNNSYIIPNQNQNITQYDTQHQYGYDDNRISFLALGDSAIEPRQKSLALKEEIIKKSKDNIPIPLVHINNKKGPNGDEENKNEKDEDEDNINLKAVEPLPDTIIPSKNNSQRISNNRFLHESHDLFKKVSRGVKSVGNHLKPNSIISTISSSSKSSNDKSSSSISSNNNNNQYSILYSPKE